MSLQDSAIQKLLSSSASAAAAAADPKTGSDSSEFDSGTARVPVDVTKQPENLTAPNIDGAPGSFRWHLQNNISAALTNPKVAPAVAEPGGLMKAFVLGGIQALGQSAPKPAGAWSAATSNDDATKPTTPPAPGPSRGQQVINHLSASFGDLAAATEGGPAGGALAGAARVARASSQRQMQEQKDKQLIATSNAQMVHEQALTHQLGEEQVAKAVVSGKEGLSALLNAEVPGTLLAEGKTSDQLKDMIDKGELNPTTQTVFLTGRIQTGNDKNGQPMFRSTYSVVKPAGEVKLSEEQAKYINTQLHMDLKGGGDNPQVLPAVQFNHLWQQAQGREVTTAAFKHDLAKVNADADKANFENEVSGLRGDSLVTQAISNAARSGAAFPSVTAYQELLKDPKFMAEHKDFSTAYPAMFGAENFEKMQSEAAKEVEKKNEKVDKKWSKYEEPGSFAGDKGPAAIGELTAALADQNAPLSPEDRVKATKFLSMAKSATQQTVFFQQQKDEAAQRAKDGDPKSTGYMLYHHQLAPEEIKARSNPEYLKLAVAEAERLAQTDGKHYSAPVADQQYKVAQSPQLQIQFGNANSLVDKGGTIDQVIEAHKDLKPGKFPIWNSLSEVMEYHAGDPELAGFRTAVIGMADDFAKVMGGAAGSDHARDQMIQAFTYAMNQGQMGKASGAAKKAVTSQIRAKIGTNPYLMEIFGYNLPEYHTADQQTTQEKKVVKPHTSDLQRPARFPTASGTREGSDGKLYWWDGAKNKPLGPLTTEEQAIADKE